MELEIREVEIRSVDAEERTVSGIAVPYGQTTNINGYKERIEKGAFRVADGVQLFYGHDHRNGGMPIGRILEGRDTDEGLEIKAQLSKTAKADEVYTLLRDGVLNKFSIGFVPVKSKREGDVVVRQQGDLKEVSIVAIPAYSQAAVSQVRADQINSKEDIEMSNEINAPEVSELRDAVSDLERKFAVLSENGTGTKAEAQYRSGGEFLKALAAGEEAAKVEVRAFTGATTADSIAGASWVSRTLTLVEENREILNLFDRSPLPASGNSIEYPFVASTSGTVGVQAAEGDDLPYMEVVLDTASAPVRTYGGYSSLSRQAIERSDVAYLDAVLRYQGLQYAKATNGAVRAAVAGAAGTSTVPALAADNGQAWVRTVLAGRRAVKGANSQAAVMVVSGDVYDRLFTIVDASGRPVFNLNGDGSNTFGNGNLVTVSGSIAGLPVVVDDAAGDDTCWILGKDAVTVFEQPGAPVRLADENIINLTKDFSLYGYMAVAVTNPAAIVRVDVDLVA